MTRHSGYDPTHFDGVSNGYTGISGVLHNHYDQNLGPSVMPRTIGPTWIVEGHNSVDTHFLIDASATVSDPLTEDYFPITDTWPPGGFPTDEGYSAETRYGYYGVTVFGDNLTGAMDIVHVGATWDIAQVVTNDRNSILLDFYLRGTPGAGGGEYINVLIPEPATLGVLALGGVALLRRSRFLPVARK
ncbi:MAG: PEP-CTERM sorting domain-containing protein [Planctomycetota bacterium]|jgi:hypothetical protein